MATNVDSIKEALLEMLSPKKAKKAKTPKYVLVVNNSVCQQRPTNKAELTEAVIAIKLKNPSAKVFAYKLAGELKLDLPVTGLSIAADSAQEAQGE